MIRLQVRVVYSGTGLQETLVEGGEGPVKRRKTIKCVIVMKLCPRVGSWSSAVWGNTRKSPKHSSKFCHLRDEGPQGFCTAPEHPWLNLAPEDVKSPKSLGCMCNEKSGSLQC